MQPPTFVLAAERAPDPTASAAGNAFPFEELLCAEAPRLRRLVHRLFGWSARTSDVDDVVQEALLAAWRHRATFRGEAGVATWLVQIAVRKARSHARAANLRRRVFGWWTHDAAEAIDRDGESLQQDRLDATHVAMAALRHADREVLVLRYLEQRQVEQIAQVLRCSRAAVDARLSRARKRLRARLGLEEPT